MMTQFNRESLMLRAVDNASKRSEFLGYLFGVYAKANGLGKVEMAMEFGCSEETLAQMSLCLRPGRGSRNFGEDVDRISTRFSIDSRRLVSVVRSAEALEAFQDVESEGMLMAAREWEEDDANNKGKSQNKNSG